MKRARLQLWPWFTPKLSMVQPWLLHFHCVFQQSSQGSWLSGLQVWVKVFSLGPPEPA